MVYCHNFCVAVIVGRIYYYSIITAKENIMLRKLIPFIFSAIIFITLSPYTSHAESGDFTYTIINGEATVIGFTGEPETLEIPSVIEGCPVTEIRDNAFFSCTSLRSITFPDTLRVMGHHCFYACTSLERIELPLSLEEIGMGCFCGCVTLKEVHISEKLDVLPDSCFRSCTSLESIIIPQNIAVIEKFCFSGCTNLENVSLSGRLEQIGSYSFYMCNSLRELYIPPSVTAFGTEAVGFIPAADGTSPSSSDGFTIYGERESHAQEYAKCNNIAFSDSAAATGAMAFIRDAASSANPAVKLTVCGIAAILILLLGILFHRRGSIS